MTELTFSEIVEFPVLRLRRNERIRAAVVALFREQEPGSAEMLAELTPAEWKALLYWLDTSGLALYLLDRLRERELISILPADVRERLEQNLLDNTARTTALVDECCAIQAEFADAGVRYAVLKGFSLWPHSVPKLELRSQLDLDFLVAADDEARAQAVMERRGYQLHGVSGRSREFKTPHSGAMTLAGLYRPWAQRNVEVHLEGAESGLLGRCEHHTLSEIAMPVLPAADLFLGQALHLYKHLSRDQMRTSHLLELYRHLLARGEDEAFWAEVESLCAGQPGKALGLGVALDFVSQQMEATCVPVAVRRWTIERVPLAARLWVRRYGARTMTAGFPGTKLHLLLREAMGGSVAASLVPRGLPPRIAIAEAGESLGEAMRRVLRQWNFVVFRLRFHVREGVRYGYEARRWRRLLRVAGAGGRVLMPLSVGSVQGSRQGATKL